ncbi:hypothetical protein, partial [Mesorhizobium sp.]|uniref:hypothetical protein n=1 Tax=Mesorhizobium sp. TaxID=1871066 RepID=UPI000FE63893
MDMTASKRNKLAFQVPKQSAFLTGLAINFSQQDRESRSMFLLNHHPSHRQPLTEQDAATLGLAGAAEAERRGVL